MRALLLDAKPGDKVKFTEEAQAYTIQARSDRFLVCTKPFNLKRTVLYTIVDLQRNIRGTENLIFGAGAETVAACTDMVARLEGTLGDWQTEISYRNNVPLSVDKITKGPGRFCGFCDRTAAEGPCSMGKTEACV